VNDRLDALFGQMFLQPIAMWVTDDKDVPDRVGPRRDDGKDDFEF
jgi:hypothetical protein